MSRVFRRAIDLLAWPLKRLRNLVTQRTENVLRHEIRLLHERLGEVHAEFGRALDMRDERIRALEIAAADSYPWSPPPPAAGETPLFSIVLPTHNRASLLPDAVRSVLAQTFAGWELLIADDGSTDDTVERLEPYLADPRIRYERLDHVGEAKARNAALRRARGELIAYLDSDNAWFPNYLARMKAEFEADPELDCAYGILVTDGDIHAHSRLLWAPFDHAALLRGNYIDINAFVHRRALVQRHGMFDEQVSRLCDWDLVLRYTQQGGCRRVDVAAAQYRTRVAGRISDMETFGDNWLRVRRKFLGGHDGAVRPKVLYALWHYPQLSETYVETELQAMLRFGAEIQVWSSEDVATPYPPGAPLRRGSLHDAITQYSPDLVHVHWVTSALTFAPTVAAAGLPMTVRSHGFEVRPDIVERLLNHHSVSRLTLFPGQPTASRSKDPRIAVANTAFDPSLFMPAQKDRRLIVRTGTAQPSKDPQTFFEIAKRLPQFRCVLIVSTVFQRESYVEELQRLKAQLDSPAELLIDLPREQAAQYVRDAGIYLHTVVDPSDPHFTPIGMPISIAEAMATGAYVLVRDVPPLRNYIGDAGAVYADPEQACELIRQTQDWPESQWRAVDHRAIDRAFQHFADEVVLRPLYDHWCILASLRRAGASPPG